MNKTARIISYLSDGTLISIVVFYLFAKKYVLSPVDAALWTLVTLVFSTFIPFSVIFYFWRRGKISSLHLDRREERWRFFMVSIISAFSGFVVLKKFGAPPPLTVSMLNYVFLATIMMTITLFWKISLHASTVSAFAMAIIMVFGIQYAWVYLFVLPVLWARYALRKHTVSQLIAGTFVAGVITFFTFSQFLK